MKQRKSRAWLSMYKCTMPNELIRISLIVNRLIIIFFFYFKTISFLLRMDRTYVDVVAFWFNFMLNADKEMENLSEISSFFVDFHLICLVWTMKIVYFFSSTLTMFAQWNKVNSKSEKRHSMENLQMKRSFTEPVTFLIKLMECIPCSCLNIIPCAWNVTS